MALTVTVDDPNLEPGEEVAITDLGLFENGKSREVTEDEEQRFVFARQMHVKDALADSKKFKVTGKATVTSKDIPEISETPEVADEGGES